MVKDSKPGVARRWCLGSVYTLRRISALLGLLLLVCTGCGGGSEDSASPAPAKILFISDVHLDPLGDPALFSELDTRPAQEWREILSRTPFDWGAYGEETTPWMFFSMLDRIQEVGAQADFVVFLGDLLAHNFEQKYCDLAGSCDAARLHAFILKAYHFFYESLGRAVPGKKIIFTLGNNDYDCGDYEIQPSGPLLAGLSPLVSNHLELSAEEQSSYDETFPRGGYYSLSFPGRSNLRLIVLNAVFFSVNYTNNCGFEPDTAPGQSQLEWLENQLEETRRAGEQAWLLLHIPPGLDIYSTIHDHLHQGGMDGADSLWREEFGRAMQALLSRYADTTAALFSGHIHRDDFRLGPAGVFGKIFPALTPVYGNNPAFALLSFAAEEGHDLDYSIYYLDLPANQDKPYGNEQWRQEYRFKPEYGLGGMSFDSLLILHQTMANDSGPRQSYEEFYDVSNEAAQPMPDPDRFRAYWCGQSEWLEADFLACWNLQN